MKNNFLFILKIFFFCTLSFCSNDKEKKAILPIKQMTNIVWQLCLVDEYVGNYLRLDTIKKHTNYNTKMYKQVLNINRVTQPQFENSLQVYLNNPVLYKSLINSLDSLAEKEKQYSYEKYIKTPIIPNKIL